MLTETTSLRPAVPIDARQIADIWHQGWRDGHLGFVPDELRSVRTEESFHRRAAQRVGDTTVATVRGEVAGFVMVVDDEVEQVYVARQHRGTDVADTLLDEAEREISDAGYSSAWLAVVAGNTRGRRFYERRGWSDAGPFDYLAKSDQGPIPVPCRLHVKSLVPEYSNGGGT